MANKVQDSEATYGSKPRTVRVREVKLVYGKAIAAPLDPVKSAVDAAVLAHALIGPNVVEHFVAFALDSKNRPVAWTTIGVGTVAGCPVSPSDVFRFVLLTGAHSFIVAHNHPSGDPTPSSADVEMTNKLREGATLLGLRLVDHVIVSDGGIASFLDRGLL